MEGKAIAGPGKNVLDKAQLHQAGLVNAEEAVRRQLDVILGEGMGRGIGAAGGVDDAVPGGNVGLDIDHILHVVWRFTVTATFGTGAAAGAGGAAVQDSNT